MQICLIFLIAEIGITFSCLRLGVVLITKDLAFVLIFYISHKANFNRKRLFSIGNVCAPLLSHIRIFVTPWTVARQAPLSMGFTRQEYWSGLPCPSAGGRDLPGLGLKPQRALLTGAEPEPPALAAGLSASGEPGAVCALLQSVLMTGLE